MAGAIEEAGRVGSAAVGAMSSQPLAIALLIVNIGFLAFAGYILGEVATNAQERNKTQMDLIGRLADDIRDCRQGPRPSSWVPKPLRLPPIRADMPWLPVDGH